MCQIMAKGERTISELLQQLAKTEEAVLADCMRRLASSDELECALSAILADEARQYLTAIASYSGVQSVVRIVRSEEKWKKLPAIVDANGDLWARQNLLWQIEASIVCSVQFCEQAKKSFPYSEEQLFLEGYLHEKKKSRRKVEEVLRFVQNRIWERTGFAPYCY